MCNSCEIKLQEEKVLEAKELVEASISREDLEHESITRTFQLGMNSYEPYISWAYDPEERE